MTGQEGGGGGLRKKEQNGCDIVLRQTIGHIFRVAGDRAKLWPLCFRICRRRMRSMVSTSP